MCKCFSDSYLPSTEKRIIWIFGYVEQIFRFLGLFLSLALTLTSQKVQFFLLWNRISWFYSFFVFYFFHQMKNNCWSKMINAPPLFYVWKNLLFWNLVSNIGLTERQKIVWRFLIQLKKHRKYAVVPLFWWKSSYVEYFSNFYYSLHYSKSLILI